MIDSLTSLVRVTAESRNRMTNKAQHLNARASSSESGLASGS